MDFTQELRNRIDYAETVINKYIPKNNEYNTEIIDAMSYCLNTGGKRLRPVLINSAYRLYGKEDDGAESFMAAMEMLHTYSLVHDDLPALDNDDMRRGMPTCHIKYGEAVGVLTGDGLLHLAYETALTAFDNNLNTTNIIKALRIFGNKTGLYGMFGGQSADVINTGTKISDELLAYIYENKTAALIEGSLMIGGALAGASEDDIDTLMKIGSLIGTAFQIRDDILDEYGDEAVFGKPIHSDERNNKKTYLSIHGFDKSMSDVKEYTNKAEELIRDIGTSEEEKQFLIELFRYLTLRNI